MWEFGLRKLRSEQQDGETDGQTWQNCFTKVRTGGANTLHRSTKAVCCWAESCPSQTLSSVLCIKSPLFSYANSRHFSNRVKFNLCSTLRCFWKTAVTGGPEDTWKVHTLGKFGKSNFYLYTPASACKLPLQSYFCLLAQICQLLGDISVSWEEDAFLGGSDIGADQWASHFGGSWGQATSQHHQGPLSQVWILGCCPERSTAGRRSVFYFLVWFCFHSGMKRLKDQWSYPEILRFYATLASPGIYKI